MKPASEKTITSSLDNSHEISIFMTYERVHLFVKEEYTIASGHTYNRHALTSWTPEEARKIANEILKVIDE